MGFGQLLLESDALGRKRAGHAPHLRRLRDPDGTDPDERDHYACDGCGLVVDALAASPARCAGCKRDLRSRFPLTRFCAELGGRETSPNSVR